MDSSEFFKGGQVGFRFLRIDLLAEHVGVAEAPLRFMLGIVIGFPLAFMFLLVPRTATNARHLYFALCGMFISYFCFGSDGVYNLISVLVSYVSLILFGGTLNNVIFAITFQTTYLIGAYLFYASDGYDVKWTTPQCILCLRLIGLSWDCYDGRQKKETLRGDLKKTCYEGTPTLLQVLGYSYFFGGFMAGPQFSFQRYTNCIEDKLMDDGGRKATNSRFWTSFKRFAGGVVSLLIFLKYDPSFPCDDLITEEFIEKSFFTKCTQITLTYHIHFCKYVTIWFFSESICTITGLSYNGIKDGNSKWDGVRNFEFRKVLFGPFFQDMLEGFNINTSQWAGRYIFRRLMFLGNKTASHVITLLFLSIWHGFYVGYLILFTIEFFLVIGERQICGLLKKYFNTTYDEQPIYIKLPIRIFNALFRAYACAFAATAFMLLRWKKIKIVYGAVHYWLIIVLVLLYFAIYVLTLLLKKTKKTEKKEE